ncbi:MAG: adenine-specific methyltransferase EcoRI family protein [Candidatus Saccharimonadales bacterium]
MAQKNLHTAKQQKLDEFYTQIGDIERECSRYKDQFKDKVIFLNCDDPLESNFWRYFALNFTHLGLKKLIATHFERTKPSYKLELTGDMNEDGTVNDGDILKTPLKQNGDFRSPECVEILKSADIVVTNPPFSLFREYVEQLIKNDKKFLVIGPKNAITYKEISKLIKENKLWLGYGFLGGNAFFKTPYYSEFGNGVYNPKTGLVKFRNVVWFTNLDTPKRHEEITLFKKFTLNDYPKYDNYDAVEISRVANIPADYKGVMGVPITFLENYNPEQFEIVKFRKGDDGKDLTINGKSPYFRILIRNKKLKEAA